jgi:superfamily II DNA/RNA helicase
LVSRGVDFKHATTVIHYDFPLFAQYYLHRVGRTCRTPEKNGESIAFFTEADMKLASLLQIASLRNTERKSPLTDLFSKRTMK